MDIRGTLSDEDFIEFIGMKLKLNSIKRILVSQEFNEQVKLLIIRGLMTDVEVEV